MTASIAAYVTAHVTISPTGCWEWALARKDTGYGVLTFEGRTRIAHRASYEAFVGPIPEGLTLDHLCRVRHCVNPAHLDPVTQRENVLRSPLTVQSRNLAKTHCPAGHAYDDLNTWHYSGRRYCRACKNARARARRAVADREVA